MHFLGLLHVTTPFPGAFFTPQYTGNVNAMSGLCNNHMVKQYLQLTTGLFFGLLHATETNN